MKRGRERVYWILGKEMLREFELCNLEGYNKLNNFFPVEEGVYIELCKWFIFSILFYFSLLHLSVLIFLNKWYQSYDIKILRKLL